MNSYQEQKRELDDKISDVNNNIQLINIEQRIDIDDLKKKNKKLQAEIDDLKEKINDLELITQRQTKELNLLQSSKQEKEAIDEQLLEYKKELAKIQAINKNLQLENKTLHKKMNDMQLENKNLHKKMNDMELENTNLHKKMNDMEFENKNLHKKMNNMQLENKNLHKKISEVEEQVKDLLRHYKTVNVTLNIALQDETNNRNRLILRQFVNCLEGDILHYVLPDWDFIDYPLISQLDTMPELTSDERRRWKEISEICPWRMQLINTISDCKSIGNTIAFPTFIKGTKIPIHEVQNVVKQVFGTDPIKNVLFCRMIKVFEHIGIKDLHDTI